MDAFRCIQLWKAISQTLGKMRLCLNPDFNCFKWAESYIGKHFSRCTAKEENETSIVVKEDIGVKPLEVFI